LTPGNTNTGRGIDVLLVNPPFNRVFGAAHYTLPLGLEYMKSALEAAGFRTVICNLDYDERELRGKRILKKPREEWSINEEILARRKEMVQDTSTGWWVDFRKVLAEFNPGLVGIGMVTPQFHAAETAARVARETLPGAAIVTGGIHPTVMPEDTLSTGVFDAAAVSEGERTIIELARLFLREEGSIESVPGICFSHGGEIVRTPPVELVEDLDSLEFPAKECVVPPDMKPVSPKYSASLITSRGCPFKCTYCARSSLWMHHKVRYRGVDNVVAEIEHLKKSIEMSYFYILDDTFNVRKNRVAEFCEKLLSKKLNMKWYCYIRADRTDDEIIATMKKAGLDTVYIGAESGDQGIVDKMKRGMVVDEVRRAVEILRKHDIYITCSFIAGHPDETPETLLKTEKLLDELSAEKSIVYFMVPYPGSEIFDRMKEQDRIATYDWFRYTMYNPSLIRRDGITDEQLLSTVQSIYRRLFYRHMKDKRRMLSITFILEKLKTVRSFSRLKHLAGRFFNTLTGRP